MCEGCGVVLPAGGRARFCGDACRVRHRYWTDPAYREMKKTPSGCHRCVDCSAPVFRNARSAAEIMCNACRRDRWPWCVLCRQPIRKGHGRGGRAKCPCRPPLTRCQVHPGDGRCVECRRIQNRRKDLLRRARLAGVASDPYTLAELADAAGFRCQVPGCGRLVDLSLRVPDPDAATVDHVVPLARGGDDTWANVRLAHFLCNVRKGARLEVAS